MRGVGIVILGLMAAFTGICSLAFLPSAGDQEFGDAVLVLALPGLALSALCIFFIYRLIRTGKAPPPDAP